MIEKARTPMAWFFFGILLTNLGVQGDLRLGPITLPHFYCSQPYRAWRIGPMVEPDAPRPSPHDKIGSRLSRFKVFRQDPVLLKLEAILRQINRWNNPVVQQHVRLAKVGTEKGRQRAIAHLVSVIEEYKVRKVACENPFMPHATADQINNNGRGVHVLDQANSGFPLNVDWDLFLLDALIFGRQGSGKSSAARNVVKQSSCPLLILDPKNSWRRYAASIRSQVIDLLSLDLNPPPGVSWQDWLFTVMEAAAQVTGVQFGLDLLVEASQIALRQRQQYIETTGKDTSLCLKDVKRCLRLCHSQKGKRANYRTSAETALSLLIGSEKSQLFTTRRGLPLDQVLKGRYVMPCPYLSGVQSQFLGLYLFLYMRHSARDRETTQLHHLTVIDDASAFLSKPSSTFGPGPRFGPWMHILKVLRSSGYGAIFIDQSAASVLDDIKQLCHFWLVVGSIQGRGNQNEVATAMSLSQAQKEMLGRLQTRECVCFCPAGHPKYPYPIHGVIPEIDVAGADERSTLTSDNVAHFPLEPWHPLTAIEPSRAQSLSADVPEDVDSQPSTSATQSPNYVHPYLDGAAPTFMKLCYDLLVYPYGNVRSIIQRLRISAREFEKQKTSGCEKGLILESSAGASTYLIPTPRLFEAFGLPCPYDLTSVEHSYYTEWAKFHLAKNPSIKSVKTEFKIGTSGATADLMTLGHDGIRCAYEVTLSVTNILANATKYTGTDFSRIVFLCRDHKLRDAVKAYCRAGDLEPALLAKLDYWQFSKLLRRQSHR